MFVVVPVFAKDVLIADEAFVTSDARQGLLKVLNRFECHFVSLFFNTNAVFNVRNLMYLVNDASGRTMFNKNAKIEPFIITHRHEFEQIDTNTTLFTNDTNTTLFTNDKTQHFVILSRRLLPLLIDANNTNVMETTFIAPLSFESVFRHYSNTENYDVVFVDTSGYKHSAELKHGVKGLKAWTTEQFGFTTLSYMSTSMHQVRRDINLDSDVELMTCRLVDNPTSTQLHLRPTQWGHQTHVIPTADTGTSNTGTLEGSIYDLHASPVHTSPVDRSAFDFGIVGVMYGVPCRRAKTEVFFKIVSALEDEHWIPD